MDVRPLFAVEREVVDWFAQRVDELQRRDLLADLDKAMAEEIRDEHLTIRFHINGYTRPPYRFERPLLSAPVLDADGAKLHVTVSLDENGLLCELQVIRFDRGPVLGPEWSTLRLYDPGEVIDLGPHSMDERQQKGRSTRRANQLPFLTHRMRAGIHIKKSP
jgi:hypothetical protein